MTRAPAALLLVILPALLVEACAPPPGWRRTPRRRPPPAAEAPRPAPEAPRPDIPADDPAPAAPASPDAPVPDTPTPVGAPAPAEPPAPTRLPLVLETPPEPALSALEQLALAAEGGAAPGGRAVLAAARRMIDSGEIVVGSCWTYANAVYERAGFPSGGRLRETVFAGSPKGRFANLGLVRAGDLLSYINHSYGDVAHSAIFVGWVDREANRGLMINYRGGRRREPGHYAAYDLSHVYRVVRPREPDRRR